MSESVEVIWTWAPRLMIGLAVLVVALEVMPRGSSLITEIQAWRADASRVASIETLAEDRGSVRVERAKLARQLAEANTERATTGDMLGRLDAFAADASVNLTRVEPGLPVVEGAQERVPLAVDLNGRFHDVGDFVADLEASAFRVRRLALTKPEGPGVGQGLGSLEASLTLEVVRSPGIGGRDE
ncbi:MAG: type 4a pilus biogenesis protein PilO [Bacteroidota bacterium]